LISGVKPDLAKKMIFISGATFNLKEKNTKTSCIFFNKSLNMLNLINAIEKNLTPR